MSKRGKRRDGGKGKAYYPSSSALNYLNANDVRGRDREREKERVGEERRGGEGWRGRKK